jgi:cell division protein FtsQ
MLALAALVALLACGWLWVRDSSLVAVRRVTLTGISGPDAGQIRRALTMAARNMTTLDVRMSALRSVVAPYPVVKNLQVTTEFPHGMRIRVIEQIPVATMRIDGRVVAVAQDGTLLHDAPQASLPVIPLAIAPGGTRLTDPGALRALTALAAAPYQMLSHLSEVTTVAGHGLVAQLRGGPAVYLGDTTQLAAKWIAASAVLADPGSAGASYIDVTDPRRPAAGGGAAAAAAAAAAAPAPPAATTTAPAAQTATTATTPAVTTATTPSGG